MSTPIFRLVCQPSALDDAPEGWATDMLTDGEVTLLIDDGGTDAINSAAHQLGALTVAVMRREASAEAQEATVREHAASLPLIWVAPEFTESARKWAHDRGPMTLLVDTAAPLTEEERGRLTRFVSILGRQTD
ncbi:MAG: hypothetical protein J7513_13680 [Solirubrobacteraceae bacterium]|nr:hypothetical protein [Solirubrobacteraceae bacterium]